FSNTEIHPFRSPSTAGAALDGAHSSLGPNRITSAARLDLACDKPKGGIRAQRVVYGANLSLADFSNGTLTLPHDHSRQKYGWRTRPLARYRHEGRRLRQADHCRGELVHPVRARTRASKGP